jgi:hypothetical protein
MRFCQHQRGAFHHQPGAQPNAFAHSHAISLPHAFPQSHAFAHSASNSLADAHARSGQPLYLWHARL